MLVYPLPPDKDFPWSLKDISCSIRDSDTNEKLKSLYFKLSKKFKEGKVKSEPIWPPEDDPYCEYHVGWHVPGYAVTPRDSDLGVWTERFCAHEVGLACMQSANLANCLGYVHHLYVAKYGDKEWVPVKGETNSYRRRKMVPQEEHWQLIRKALRRLFKKELTDRIINDKLVLCTDIYPLADIEKTYEFCLKYIARWALMSYLHYPEEWTAGTGEYSPSSLFGGQKVLAVPALKIDVLSPEIMAAVDAPSLEEIAKAKELEEEQKAKEETKVAKKKRRRKPSDDDLEHWLDDPDHSFMLRHGEEA